MIRLQVMSDLHSEFLRKDGIRHLPKIVDGVDYVLIAGDFATQDSNEAFKEWIRVNPQVTFVAVPGNHDYWGGKFSTEDLRNLYRHFDNLELLIDESLDLPGLRIFGTTLWTNLDNPLAQIDCQRFMVDHRAIQNFSIKEWQHSNFISEKILREVLKESRNKPLVVLTHHTPSRLSEHPSYYNPNDYLWQSFHNSLDDLIEEEGPDIWIHGHTHDSYDYLIGNTRVICNPYGYFNYQVNPSFNPSLILEI